MTEATEDPVCPCCTFGNHTERCTCDGSGCCHPERHRPDDLLAWQRAYIDAHPEAGTLDLIEATAKELT